MTVRATAESTDDAFTLLEGTEPPHLGPPMHCPAGSFVYMPAGAVHGFRVGNRPSKKLNLYVPQAMVGYFDELAERYGMEVLGPVPEGYV